MAIANALLFCRKKKKGRMYVLHPLVLTVCVINSKYMNVFFSLFLHSQLPPHTSVPFSLSPVLFPGTCPQTHSLPFYGRRYPSLAIALECWVFIFFFFLKI